MRALAYLCLLLLCLGLTGCSLFGKKAQTKQNQPGDQAPGGSWPAQPEGAGSAATERTSPNLGGILAGRVIDSYDRRPPPTFIQVVSAREARDSKGQPLEVATDSQGYFTIQGLKPGQHYQLIARTREGEPKLAGTTWAIPPNPRVLIYISQDFVTPNTPPPPSSGTLPDGKAGQPKDQAAGASTDPTRDPARPSSVPGPRTTDIAPPIKTHDPASSGGAPANGGAAQPKTEVRPEDIAVDPKLVRQDPVTNIPPQVKVPPPPLAPTSESPRDAAIPAVATHVPSCVLTGRQLHNFALNDLNAQAWEYRNHRGRLVLLDFWGTWCLPCREAIPHLKILQESYGPFGLEVIGIAYEDGPLQEQIRKVQGVRDRLGIGYRLLLGSDLATCPVKTQFEVSNLPTLVLLDEHNRIIWRQEGFDGYKLQELDMLIRQQLRVR